MGKRNSSRSSEKRRYEGEDHKRRLLTWFDTDIERRKLGEPMGLDTPVVLAVNDGYSVLNSIQHPS